MTTFSLEHAHPTQVISHSAPQPSSLWDTTGIDCCYGENVSGLDRRPNQPQVSLKPEPTPKS